MKRKIIWHCAGDYDILMSNASIIIPLRSIKVRGNAFVNGTGGASVRHTI